MADKYVAYLRVSTKKQGRSGLGLEAQREIVRNFATSRAAAVVEYYTETESGKLRERPELARALAACRLHRATLIVAKLDRLARNAAFLLSLRDSGVELLACDLPSMNRMTVGIMAVVAEEEARLISERTRAALAAAKRRGRVLGNPRNLSSSARRTGSQRSAEARRIAANDRAADLAPIITNMISHGARSLNDIARRLDQLCIPTSRGATWTPTAVRRVLKRLRAATS